MSLRNLLSGFIRAACVIAMVAGCSDWSPNAGAPQSECTYGSAAGSYVTYATGNTTCALLNAGEDCEGCQAANCCAPSRNCYADSSCKTADSQLDTCVGNVSDASTAEELQSTIANCRAAFAASGLYANDVIQCETLCCPAKCVALPLTQ